jgi:catechol 2,3-dioxygenase-like lactoylglutathione lyase family enzyme
VSELELKAAVPVLPVEDVDKAVDFYTTRLGFEKAFAYGAYAGVQRGAVMIHLDAGERAAFPGPTCCRVDVQGVDALSAEMEAQGVVDPDEPLETKPFGMRQFSVLDCCGNRITFAEPA